MLFCTHNLQGIASRLPIICSLFLFLPQSASALCLEQAIPSDACRYPQGDSWCAESGSYPFAYRDACISARASSSPQALYDSPMTFYQGWSGGNALEALWIVAIGVIEPDSHEKFRAAADRFEGTKVVLHSPGGDLVGAIELGREIRKRELDTFVGSSINSTEYTQYSGGTYFNNFAPGKCLSACAGLDHNSDQNPVVH
jgi:hypothetical protein